MKRCVPLAAISPLVAVFMAASFAVGQDVVYIAAGSEGGQTKVGGQIVDYDGRELLINVAGGVKKSFPAQRVLRVETQYGRQHLDADTNFAQGRFNQALALYQRAMQSEARRWVRRQIIAQWVWCYRALGQADAAGEAFLLLIRDDPNTLHFDCIPLAWLTRQTPAAVERSARQWLGREEPAAVLLGASHMLSTAERASALTKLRELSAASDRRIAQLAMAQSWRADPATVDAETLRHRRLDIEQMPELLQAGPYFVLGSAFLQQQQWEKAALALLRAPILYPRQRDVAAQSLADAGRAMEKLGRNNEALRLYRELSGKYPDQTRPVTEASSRMESMTREE